MNKDILDELKNIKESTERNHPGYAVKDVVHYNKKVEIVKEDGKIEEFDLTVVLIKNIETNEGYQLYYLNGREIPIIEFLKNRELLKNIQKVIDETQQNTDKPEEEQDKELKKESLEELEQEKKQELKEEREQEDIEKDEDISSKKRRKPSHVIERINPDEAKMDYWQTIKQACGLPAKVDTLAFAYPVSSEDKVDYANITVYMLDKDGYIIDDLDVDDYFEFDSSTGNNPMLDNVVRHEEDENEGKAQIEGNRTMIRLYAKKSGDRNTYISLEQKNSFGDYNDINAGRKTVAGTQNVEKQLETDRVRVWDSEKEKLMKSNAGMYNINDIFEEAEQHKEHDDDGYIHTENSDGNSQTIEICNNSIIPGTDRTWEELSEEVGEGIKKLQERFEREFERGKKPEDIIKEIEYDYDIAGHEHKHS